MIEERFLKSTLRRMGGSKIRPELPRPHQLCQLSRDNTLLGGIAMPRLRLLVKCLLLLRYVLLYPVMSRAWPRHAYLLLPLSLQAGIPLFLHQQPPT